MASNVIAFPRPLANDNSDRTPPPVGATGSVVALPVSSDTPQMRFERAYHYARVAQAEYRLHESRRMAWIALEGDGGRNWRNDPYLSTKPHEMMQATIFKLATTPAASKSQLARKKDLIGKVWLKARGEFYDYLRAGVEIDELRFGKRRAA